MIKPTQNMFVDDEQTTNTPHVEEQKPKKQTTSSKKPKLVEEEVEEVLEAANFIELPSNGQFGYPASVSYRDMLAKDEEVLASATASTYARTLNGVIKSVLNDCEWYEQMCVHDRDFVLIWLWANNYNAIKKVTVMCNSCEHEDNVTVDLTKLDIIDPDPKLTGAISLDLKSGHTVKVRLNTVQDELDTERYLTKNKNAQYENVMRALSIDVGLPMPIDSKLNWIKENVTAKEMGIVRAFHDKFAFGVKTKLEHTCSSCGEVTNFMLPFSAEDVLSPTVSVDFEEFL